MFKAAITLILVLLLFYKADAQTDKDTVHFYVKLGGVTVSSMDEADYLLFVMPADSSSGKKLYPIVEYYPNGKQRMIGKSLNQSAVPKLDGPSIFFFSNGHKKSIKNYSNGVISGDQTEYFPNGKLYNIKKFNGDDKVFIECRDSTGKVLAENGNGTWVVYNDADDFSTVMFAASVRKGVLGKEDHSFDVNKYADSDQSGKIYTKTDVLPEFKGGIDSFHKFLADHIKYPKIDLDNRITGTVLITLIVEKDGTLNRIRAERGPSQSAIDEVLRTIRLSPVWTPGSVNSVPVRTLYTFSVKFDLNFDSKNKALPNITF